MSAIIRCDTCRAEALYLTVRGTDAGASWLEIDHAASEHREVSTRADFCSWKCVAEYVTARMMIEGATNEEP